MEFSSKKLRWRHASQPSGFDACENENAAKL